MDLSEFHFLRPWWLLGLFPLIVLIWLMARERAGSGAWRAVVDPELIPHVLIGSQAPSRPWPLYGVGLSGLLAVLALAGPTWDRLPQPVMRSQSALVIALDLSLSMDASDLKPSRLARARFKIADMLKQRREGQSALLVYAGDAFTVTPLTEDTATIASQLPVLTTRLMPNRGSRADLALKRAGELLKQAGLKRGDILLVTDGVNTKRAEKVINDMIEQGYRISILGVGTPQGGPVRLGSGGFLKDSDGAIVIPKLAIANLRDLARLGRGIYRTLSVDDSDVSALLAPLGARPGQEEVEATRLTADVWHDRGPWLLLALVPLAALGFRRGSLMIVMVSGILVPGPAKALDWASLWSRPDQQAFKALKEGDRERAAGLFTDPKWKAAVLYRSGDYEATLESLAGLDDPDSLYNKGNALARLGRYPEAIEAYDKALTLKPDHEDARHNRDLLKQLAQDQSRQAGGERSEAQDPRDAQQDGPAQQGRSGKGPEQNADRQKNNGEHEQSNPHGQTQGAASHSAKRQEQATEPGQRDGAPSASPLASAGSNKLPQRAVEGKLAVNGQPGPKAEADQAVEQWLRRIPDDPGGLLRRKFYYQYQQRGEPQLNDDQPW